MYLKTNHGQSMKKYKLKTTIITCFSTGGTLGYNPLLIIKAGEILTEQANGKYAFDDRKNEYKHIVFPFFDKIQVEENADLFELI